MAYNHINDCENIKQRTVKSAFPSSSNSTMSSTIYSELFKKFFDATRRFAIFVGVDVVGKNYKISFRTCIAIMVLNCGIFVTLYTVYIDIVRKKDYYNVFKSLSILGSGIQGYVKLITAIRKASSFHHLYKEIMDIYLEHDQKSEPYRNCLKNTITMVKKIIGSLFMIVFVSVLFFLLAPITVTIIYNTRMEILPYILPYVDMENDLGYYFTIFTQIVCVIFAVFGSFASDVWLFVFVAHVPMIKNIIKCKFDDIDEYAATDSKTAATSNELLKDVFKWHQRYNAFLNTIKSTVFWVIFTQISTEFLGIVFTIVCIFLGIWPTAPALALYLFLMIYSYCALGNLVESANDDLTDMIYNCKWYKFIVKEQKMILIMLRESQQATVLSIGGVAPLSLNTALQLTKTIYTFSMMLKESFE